MRTIIEEGLLAAIEAAFLCSPVVYNDSPLPLAVPEPTPSCQPATPDRIMATPSCSPNPPPATDQVIQKWVERRHGLNVETDWIAHCRELCGIDEASAQRRDRQECPPDKIPAIKQAFRRFGMLLP